MNREHCIAEIKARLEKIYEPLDESLDVLLSYVEVRSIKKSEQFQKEYAPSKEIGLLLQGTMIVKRLEKNGKEKVVFFNTPDRTPFVGTLETLIKDEESNVQIIALEDSWLGVINYKKLLKLYGEYHQLERLGRKILEFHYLIALEQARFRQNTPAKEKWDIAEREFPRVFELCDKKDFANYIGVNPSTFSRLLEKFRKMTRN